MNYTILEKIGEGKRGEVYKVKLKNNQIAALKWAKNYDIEKEWNILKFLNGFYAPKPIFKGKRFFIMELIEGKTLKDLLKDKKNYYLALKKALKAAFYLDLKGVYHKQLGRYNHIIVNEDIKFIDFERGVIRENPRNFFQMIGFYLKNDQNIDQEKVNKIIQLYKKNPFEGLILSQEMLEHMYINI